MKQLLVLATLMGAALGMNATAADLTGGDAEAGQNKAAACAACHGADGNSVNPEWPKLAGQHAGYLVLQLEHFAAPQAESKRFNALMYGQAVGLSEQDRADIAAYYAAQQTTPGQADPKKVELGERIYRGGIAEKDVPACIACHGPAGEGNAAANYPAVAGQHAKYLLMQLEAYARGQEALTAGPDEQPEGAVRSTDPNQMMRNTAAGLSKREMEAVASYMQGLQR
ncbi:MAG: c-type cytochrome [Gammaproteobacteria bacterium]|nr:c-type cytochrome [Gammaproteobacteria bacterium]